MLGMVAKALGNDLHWQFWYRGSVLNKAEDFGLLVVTLGLVFLLSLLGGVGLFSESAD